MSTQGHKLQQDGPITSPRWFCECGKWRKDVPARGCFGHHSLRARVQRVINGHNAHLRYVAGQSNLNRP